MKLKNLRITAIMGLLTVLVFSCSNDPVDKTDIVYQDMMTDSELRSIRGTYVQEDQMARPAINTVFVSSEEKDNFNTTAPSEMVSNYQPAFEARLLALNPGYTTNALGLDATTFTTVLAQDVLNTSLTGTTTFFDGENVLTGRALADDVINVELLLIFGGPTGGDNPQLTNDFVDTNDVGFSDSFPYLASPW